MVKQHSQYNEEQILNQLDYLKENSEFTREDFVWCYRTIIQLLTKIDRNSY